MTLAWSRHAYAEVVTVRSSLSGENVGQGSGGEGSFPPFGRADVESVASMLSLAGREGFGSRDSLRRRAEPPSFLRLLEEGLVFGQVIQRREVLQRAPDVLVATRVLGVE